MPARRGDLLNKYGPIVHPALTQRPSFQPRALHLRGKTEAGCRAGQTRPLSELQLQRELDLPRGRGGRGNDPAQWAVLGALENNLIRIREIRVIQNIERLSAELQIQSLTDPQSLQERRVEHE